MDVQYSHSFDQVPESSSSLSDAPSHDALTEGFQSRATSFDSSHHSGINTTRNLQSTNSPQNFNAAQGAQTTSHGWDTSIFPAAQQKSTALSTSTPSYVPSQITSATPRRSSTKTTIDSASFSNTKGVAKADEDASRSAVRGRGRGGRPKGRGRGGKSSKRKRSDDEDGDSDSSEVITPVTTVTKSGRSILKPSSFVPPPMSPPTATKRKRPFRQRNPENAVCKTCLRGSSPASNMIVFCDGCNSPYHRYCHKPPIDQAVVDEVDKEWFCRNCRVDVVVPDPVPVPVQVSIPDIDPAGLVSVEGATLEQRQRYFSTLPSDVLVSLLTRATTIQPDLPLFTREFKASADPRISPSADQRLSADQISQQPPIASPPLQSSTNAAKPSSHGGDPVDYESDSKEDEMSGDGSRTHPANYPLPGQGLMSTLKDRQNFQWLVDPDDAKNGVYTHVYRAPHNGKMYPATPPVRG